MGREIEIKIPLTDAEYQKIYSVIYGDEKLAGVKICKHGDVPCPVEHILKSDFYFSRYDTREERKAAGEPQVIRIRCEQYERIGSKDAAEKVEPKAFFCLKRKSIENGIEFNREDETFIEKPEVVRDLLLLSGYHQFFEKRKDAFSVYCESEVLDGCEFHLELEIINGLKYMEVEVTDEEGSLLSAESVRIALGKFVELFGLDSSKRDSRSWMDILEGGEKGGRTGGTL